MSTPFHVSLRDEGSGGDFDLEKQPGEHSDIHSLVKQAESRGYLELVVEYAGSRVRTRYFIPWDSINRISIGEPAVDDEEETT